MSSTASALIMFGVKLRPGRFVPDYGEIEEEWEKTERPPEPEDKGDYKTPAWDEWRKRLEVWRKSPRAVNIELYCCDETSRYVISSTGLMLQADWQETIILTPSILARQTPEHIQALKEFCERFGLPYQEPQWLLAARYF